MMDTEQQINASWLKALKLVQEFGWRYALEEYKRRVSFARGEKDNSKLLIETIVLATLEQKFGKLNEAKNLLSHCKAADDPIIRIEAQLRLSKILSQLGHFEEARAELITLNPPPNTRQAWNQPTDIPVSALWRLGFTSGLIGEKSESKYWFERHLDIASKSHGSQLANNLVFSTIIDIPNIHDTKAFDQAHAALQRGFKAYLIDGLSVDNVKFLSISKSVVVPLLYESVLLFRIGQKYDALLQVLICRGLLQLESISLNSEGVSEAIVCLERLGAKNFVFEIIKRIKLDENLFLSWLQKEFSREIALRAYREAQDRFQEFVATRRYEILFILADRFPEKLPYKPLMSMYLNWVGKKQAGYEIQLFLQNSMGLKVYTPDDEMFLSKSRADIAHEVTNIVNAAAIRLTSKTTYEAGVLRQALGRDNVVFLSTIKDEPTAISLGLPYILVDESIPSSCFHHLRRFIAK